MSRVRRTFWFLVFTAVVATGLVSRALTWDGATAIVTAMVAGTVALGAGLLALRIMVVTAGRRSTNEPDAA